MYKRVIDEIGSEFWEPEMPGDVKYLLAGRTALEFIIRDIIAKQDIKSVLMPSYCCHTMIMPFKLHDIDVRFYDVYYDHGLRVELPEQKDNEIFYYIKYFGYEALQGDAGVHEITIEDQTHSWMNGIASKADYTFVSYKKWTNISGLSKAKKKRGKFIDAPLIEFRAFDELREKAYNLKKQYIERGVGDKSVFLDAFDRAEELIETDYCGYGPSQRSLERLLEFDPKLIREERRRNAEYLIDELKQIPQVQVIYASVGDNDVPLFVPILVQERNELRRYLIQRKIFLPVHWPFSDHHTGISRRARQLYDHELSVICDQRYGLDDMQRIVLAIRDFYSGSNDG